MIWIGSRTFGEGGGGSGREKKARLRLAREVLEGGGWTAETNRWKKRGKGSFRPNEAHALIGKKTVVWEPPWVRKRGTGWWGLEEKSAFCRV